jgi:hypothetical protein
LQLTTTQPERLQSLAAWLPRHPRVHSLLASFERSSRRQEALDAGPLVAALEQSMCCELTLCGVALTGLPSMHPATTLRTLVLKNVQAAALSHTVFDGLSHLQTLELHW